MTHFCALALADDAFLAVKKPSDIERIKRTRLEDGSPVSVRFRDAVLDIPIMRSLTPLGGIAETDIFTANSLGAYLVGLGQRAGYKDNLTAYCFRRGFANELLETVTAVQRSQRIGHKSEDVFLRYISNKSGIDSQSIVLQRPQQKLLIDALRSMQLDVDLKAPLPHGSRLIDARRRYVQDMEEDLGEEFADIAQKGSVTLKATEMTTRQHYEIRRRARKQDFQKAKTSHHADRDEFAGLEDIAELSQSNELSEDDSVREAGNSNVASPPENAEVVTIVRPGPSKYLLAVLSWMPARLRLVQDLQARPLLSTKVEAPDATAPLSFSQGVECFMQLAKPVHPPVHYTDAFPDTRGRCRICGKKPAG